MHAESLLRSARSASSHVDALIEAGAVTEYSGAWGHIDGLQSDILDLTEWLRASSPIPVESTDLDETFTTVVAALVTVENLSAASVLTRADLPPETVFGLPQVSVFDDTITILLRDDPADWVPVLQVLRDVFSDMDDRATRISRRMRADGVAWSSALYESWDVTQSMIQVFHDIVDDLLAVGGFVERLRPEANETFDYIDWTIERLLSHD